MKVSLGLSRISLVAMSFLLASSLKCWGASGSAELRIIDRHGMQIPSIFYGISPNPKIAPEYYRVLKTKGSSLSSCSVLKTSYHDHSDAAVRLLLVQAGCQGHYQVDYNRSCGSQCSGGEEGWTFSDSDISDYCTGYAIEYTGCNTGTCRTEYTCYNDQSPGCY